MPVMAPVCGACGEDRPEQFTSPVSTWIRAGEEFGVQAWWNCLTCRAQTPKRYLMGEAARQEMAVHLL